MIPARSETARLYLMASILAIWAGTAGCLGPRHKPSASLTAEDFAPTPPRQRAGVEPPAPPTWPPDAPLSRGHGFDPVRGGPVTIETRAGPPGTAKGATPTEPPRLVDVMVGDVNGKAVFAREFFQPMETLLKGWAADAKSRSEWEQQAQQHIQESLARYITSELLLNEAQNMLEERERHILTIWLKRVEEEFVNREGGGSRMLASKAALEDYNNQTIEEKTEEQRKRFLIDEVILAEIQNPIFSTSEITREYHRKSSEINPEPTAELHVIRASSDELKAAVEERLAAGDPFETVAASELNFSFLRNNAGWKSVKLPRGEPFNTATLIPESEKVNEAVQKLHKGEFAGPIHDVGSWWWVYLADVRSESYSFYDVQLSLTSELTAELQMKKTERIVNELKARASYTSEEEMAQHLLKLATIWYWEPTRSARQPRNTDVPKE